MAAAMTGTPIRAAGGVLWQGDHADVRAALVHRSRYDDWTLPKGKVKDGEHPLLAGCREVVEETGISPVVGRRLPTTAYDVLQDGAAAPKRVDYWAMHARTGDFVPNEEVDDLRWMPLDDAADALSYPHDREVLRAFGSLPAHTTTILLVRHAKAGSKKAWKGPDRRRPLDAAGRKQARHLADVLPWFAPDRIVSADNVRCTQTVGVLARYLKRKVEKDAVFGEAAHKRHPGRAAAALRRLAGRGQCVVVSSQGGVIPDTLSRLAAEDGLDLGDIETPKGSVWALHFVGPRLVAADHLGDLRA